VAGEQACILLTTPGWEGCAYGGPQAQVDFFISYTDADRAQAEWITCQLERPATVLQAWDFRPGDNFVVACERPWRSVRQQFSFEDVEQDDYADPGSSACHSPVGSFRRSVT
jgi:hypothetical protein